VSDKKLTMKQMVMDSLRWMHETNPEYWSYSTHQIVTYPGIIPSYKSIEAAKCLSGLFIQDKILRPERGRYALKPEDRP